MKKKEASEHARALSSLGASKGGKARAANLTDEQKSEIASKAAKARWGDSIPKATHAGTLHIAGRDIECAVLEDGRRVLTTETFLTAIGRSPKGKGGQVASGPDGLPPFLSAETLKPFVASELGQPTAPLVYKTISGGRALGYDADFLVKVCEIYLKARDAEALTRQQQHIAIACDLLMRGLANVGIIALVDEATGFQYDRSRSALSEILDLFIKGTLGKWAKRFPDAFYQELFRLKGLPWPWPSGKNMPQIVGRWTNDLVYDRLAPGLREELNSKNPTNPRGHRKSKHHQWLTDDIGHPKLREHIIALNALMRTCDDWDDFHRRLNRAFPKFDLSALDIPDNVIMIEAEKKPEEI